MSIEITTNMNATEKFIAIVMNNSGCTEEQAEKVLSVYKKFKVLKFSTYDRTPHVTNGAFYEKDVIWNAINNF